MAQDLINILLVEDDKFDRMALVRHIKKMNLPYRLEIAVSNAAALAMLRQASYDVVLLDYNLGDGNGIELLSHLEGTPAIFITGSGSEEIAVQAMRLGAYDYLIKDPDHNYLMVMPSTIKNVLQRKREQDALQESEARYKGLAEFSNAVIHNVGNVLNSVMTSCENISSKMQTSKLDQLNKLSLLVEEFKNESFFRDHPKGKLVPKYLSSLSQKLEEERGVLLGEVAGIEQNLMLIKEIIVNQQTLGKVSGATISLDLEQVVKGALRIKENAFRRKGIVVHTDLEANLRVKAHRGELTHVLINVFNNAVDAMTGNPLEKRSLQVNSGRGSGGRKFLRVKDMGIGFSQEDRDRLFSHGFTTKEKGHGFGLNYCYLALRAVGGRIEAESLGPGKGACFTLFFQ